MSDVLSIEGASRRYGLGSTLASALIIAVAFAGVLHLSMTPGVPWSVLIPTTGLLFLLTAAALAYADNSDASFWVPLAALAAAFWSFNLMRRVGWVAWPNAQVIGVEEYGQLLYMQFIALVTMAAGVAWALRSVPAEGHYVRLGLAPRGGRTVLGIGLLAAFSAAVWIFVIRELVTWPFFNTGSIAVFALMALVKSLMSSVTEEAVFRGVLLPTLSRRFGIGFAVLFQALMYMSFHAYLYPIGDSRPAFLGIVFVLGVMLGSIAIRTNGLFWPVLIHMAFGMVIEWLNLSGNNSASIF